jgi:glucan phosphoethanolaminetransferase (alkaline phosphatase superfamily)
MAPKEQTEIPFIVWQGSDNRHLKELDEVGHYHIFHSVMDWFDMSSEFYNEEFSIFE